MTIPENSPIRDECEYVKNFAKQMLRNSMFTGSLQEKRYVETLNAYRDVITIGPNETKFIENLLAVKKRIQRTFMKCYWMGFTDPVTAGAPAGYNLWVILPEEVTGWYWYQVKGVEFSDNEIRLKLKIIRPVGNESLPVSGGEDETSINDILEEIKRSVRERMVIFLTQVSTWENIKTSVIFLICLIGTLLLAAGNAVKYLMDYLLKFMREVSGLIRAATPAFNSIVNLLGRIILGLFYLIWSMWRTRRPQAPTYNAYVNLVDGQHGGYTTYRQLQYYNTPIRPRAIRSRATITPLD